MSRQTMLEKLGLTIADTQPKNNDTNQRIEDIENALVELAELLTEGE